MTVYVKYKSNLGHFYMLLIKPFRLFIVYPSLLNALGLQWNEYLLLTKNPKSLSGD
jgi:hypothetical protein